MKKLQLTKWSGKETCYAQPRQVELDCVRVSLSCTTQSSDSFISIMNVRLHCEFCVFSCSIPYVPP